jgi:hypothetical protein
MKNHLASDRAFGILLSVLLIVAAATRSGAQWRWMLVGLALAAVGVAWLRPAVFAPFNRLWLRFGALLHAIVSPVVLGALFFFVFTPIGYIRRIVTPDTGWARDESAESYWVERNPSQPADHSFRDQF